MTHLDQDGSTVDTAMALSRESEISVELLSPLQDLTQANIGTPLHNWGYLLDRSTSQATVFSPNGEAIRRADDLTEGKPLDGQLVNWQRSAAQADEDPALLARDNSLQFVTSGVWFSDAEITIAVDVGGVAGRAAELGFFELVGPNNAVLAANGQTLMPDDPGYLEAALHNLIDLDGDADNLLDLASGVRDVSGSFQFQADQYYGSLLLVEDDSGEPVPLFSMAQAQCG